MVSKAAFIVHAKGINDANDVSEKLDFKLIACDSYVC